MLRVGIIRGGQNAFYDTSLQSGASVLAHIPRGKYSPVDIFVDKDGVWHMRGLPVTYDKLRGNIDVIWNSLHGHYGEDGKLQTLLENLGIPYTGSGPLASALAMNKRLAKDRFENAGVKIPKGIYFENEGGGFDIERTSRVVFEKLSPPWVIKPASGGYGLRAIRANTREELVIALQKMGEYGVPILVEEFIFGAGASVINAPGFRGVSDYTFLPIRKDNVGGRFSQKENELLQKTAKKVHDTLGLGQYSHVDIVLGKRGDVYVLGVDTVPKMHDGLVLHSSLEAVGAKVSEFIEHMIGGVIR